MEFTELRSSRARLQRLCRHHQHSVDSFRSGRTYKLHPVQRREQPSRKLHITTTATCLESLAECHETSVATETADFAKAVIETKEWVSEGSAQIYCRCRTLPFVLRYLGEHDPRIDTHLKRILGQLGHPDRFAVGEADHEADESNWYPPNAFHTYWTLEALRRFEERYPEQYGELCESLSLEERVAGMRLWARQTLAYEVGLHRVSSPALDTDQLAWSLAIATRFQLAATPLGLGDQDLIRSAVDCLFQTQNDAGSWRRYEPLFHYRDSGNAYCYPFETLAVLLRVALESDSPFLSNRLRPFLPKLLQVVDYAENTKIGLPEGEIGWSSGHRRNAAQAEGWATASVFSFLQALRRLVGIWTRDAALEGLNQISHEWTPEKAEAAIAQRGDTWSSGDPVSQQLLTGFVHPVRRGGAGDHPDPDHKPIGEDQMRSAILFGPPGTSKTSLARGVAAAIGWRFVEVHSSHFVADGLPNVQRTADEVFNRLMELDRTVVLFDEIDELVRDRENEPDSFGRFLTTSMLPKVAELWRSRKVIYFVATNHLEYFDEAIVRSQRFDFLIFVSPPSLRIKKAELRRILQEKHGVRVSTRVGERTFERALEAIGDAYDAAMPDKQEELPLPEDYALAKLILLRWDQLEELAYHLAPEVSDGSSISSEQLRAALLKVKDERLEKARFYHRFLADRGRGQRDHSKSLIWKVEAGTLGDPAPAPILGSDGSYWLCGTRESIDAQGVPGHTLTFEEKTGVVKLRPTR